GAHVRVMAEEAAEHVAGVGDAAVFEEEGLAAASTSRTAAVGGGSTVVHLVTEDRAGPGGPRLLRRPERVVQGRAHGPPSNEPRLEAAPEAGRRARTKGFPSLRQGPAGRRPRMWAPRP